MGHYAIPVPRRIEDPPIEPTLREPRRGGRSDGTDYLDVGFIGDCTDRIEAFQEGLTVEGRHLTSRFLARALHGVIANRCRSKRYRDLLPLDGGTVGIMHFASGSLRTLYQQMDLRRYFGDRAARIPDRPYVLAWWREGMRRFLDSDEARAAQQRAWRSFVTPALALALRMGWRSDRELAIAASVANSLGVGGFAQLAAHSGWRADRTLLAYSLRTAHKARRRQRLDREFPLE